MSDDFHDKNTIAKNLTDDELSVFIDELASLPRGQRTLRKIQEMAATRDLVISPESARSFRDTTFQRHLKRMERRKEKATNLAAMVADGTGRTLNDANAAILAEKIFDELNTDDDETGDDGEPARLDLEKLDALSLAVSRLRRGDQQRELLEAKLKETEAKLREYEAREKDRAEKALAARAALDVAKKTGGLSPEALRQIEEAARLL